MIKLNLLVILATVLVSALAQICLKTGARLVDHEKITGANVDTIWYVAKLLLQPMLFGGLVLYALSAVSWIWVLSKVDISIAYPFVSLSFIVTLIFGVLLFGEPLTTMKVAGTALIMLGCIMILQS